MRRRRRRRRRRRVRHADDVVSVVVPPHDGVKVVKLVVMLRKFYVVRSLKMPL